MEVLATIGSIALAILLLLIMITVHELGHYSAGKLLKFKINEFAIGFGPAIFKKKSKKSGEIFSIRIFPLGGYCAFAGEDKEVKDPGDFNAMKPWKRIIALLAGAVFNIVFALLLIMLMFGIYGRDLIKVNGVLPSAVVPANESFMQDDAIKAIDGHLVYLTSDYAMLNGKKAGDKVDFTVLRNGKEEKVTITLRENINLQNVTSNNYFSAMGIATYTRAEVKNDTNTAIKNDAVIVSVNGKTVYTVNGIKNALLGKAAGDTVAVEIQGKDTPLSVTLTKDITEGISDADTFAALGTDKITAYYDIGYQNIRIGFWEVIGGSFVYGFKIAGTIFTVLGQLITGALGLSALGGPISTIGITAKIATMGFKYFLEIAAFIGINLGIFNLLPLPALDGSRIVFTGIEWVRRKPINRTVEAWIHFVGIILLLGFSVLVDLLKLF